ncbi:hypothetical protein CASFOL_022891 [Castilleja foliolosa]|uniref:Protein DETOXIFICATION n=1 Tax=Castilleja foliolosa TaxID=1961234 RepID=A0ABD3CWA9_9LAMI
MEVGSGMDDERGSGRARFGFNCCLAIRQSYERRMIASFRLGGGVLFWGFDFLVWLSATQNSGDNRKEKSVRLLTQDFVKLSCALMQWSMGRASRPISRRSWACGAESRRDWGETVGGSTAKGESVDDLDSGAMAILACAFAEKDYQKATATAARVLQMGFVLGLGLALFVGLGLQFGSGIFTKDLNVIHMIAIVCSSYYTQPINSLAFVFDGVNFGASDFAHSAYSMVLVSIVSIGSLFVLSKSNGFVGIWVALTIYMGLRTFAGFWRWELEQGHGTFLRVVDHHHRTTYDRRVVIRQVAETVVVFGSHRRVVLGRR